MILPYILKTIQWLNIILWDRESVWPDIWPQNICRSKWPIFHGPLNLPFILKTVWCMNIILQDYESVWHSIWPRNKYRSLWPIFHGPVISLLLFFALKNILVSLEKPNSGELGCPATALIHSNSLEFLCNINEIMPYQLFSTSLCMSMWV